MTAQDTGLMIILSVGILGIGMIGGWFLTEKTPIVKWLLKKFGKKDKEKEKILNNPELLKAELDKFALIVDQGEVVEYKVVDKEGVQVLEEIRRPPTEEEKKSIEIAKEKANVYKPKDTNNNHETKQTGKKQK